MKDIVEIQEELKKLYGDNFTVVEINHIGKKPIPFLPFFGKEYTEVIIEISEGSRKTGRVGQKDDFSKEVVKELFLKELEELKKELKSLKEELKNTKKPKKIEIAEASDTLPVEEKEFS